MHRWIAVQAELLRGAASRRVPAATAVLRFAGLIPDSLGAVSDPDRGLDLDTARLAIAKDHWYPDLADALAHGHDEMDTRFEAAADAIHAGDLDILRRLLDAQRALVRMQSPFPHRQTLLHHIAANGIEVERRLQSPPNAVDVLRLLIERGADPDATCDSYGSGSGATTMCLLVSSAGLVAAGSQAALVEALCRSGAQVDGIDDDSQSTPSPNKISRRSRRITGSATQTAASCAIPCVPEASALSERFGDRGRVGRCRSGGDCLAHACDHAGSTGATIAFGSSGANVALSQR